MLTREKDQDIGLYEKYHVNRLSDPRGKHRDCEYFVLDLVHDRHAAPALLAYAASCEAEFPLLARDLREKAARIPNAARLSEREAVLEEAAKICDEHAANASVNIAAALMCVGAAIRALSPKAAK